MVHSGCFLKDSKLGIENFSKAHVFVYAQDRHMFITGQTRNCDLMRQNANKFLENSLFPDVHFFHSYAVEGEEPSLGLDTWSTCVVDQGNVACIQGLFCTLSLSHK